MGKGVEGVKRLTVVRKYCWFCEPVFWVPWLHCGTMKALMDSEFLGIEASAFCEVTLSHTSALKYCLEYARLLVRRLKDITAKGQFVWDIPHELMYPEVVENLYDDETEVARAEEAEAALVFDSGSEDEDDRTQQQSGMKTSQASPEKKLSKLWTGMPTFSF